ncbi:MAG: hypothetical protein KBD15_00600 [Candidatus Magasanikbacteria bacterium]|nr:hypothetical protein [Candidatus Magasanikbacteria bacterium]
MKFVETHLTKHHLFHAPHRWFLAFLISPLHAAEMHYKNKYHLTFRHAKKLFFFDMMLLASIIFLSISSYAWYTYDPTVRDLVFVSITSPQDRIESGEYTSHTITAQNNSDVTLTNPVMTLRLPNGFVTDKVESELGAYTGENTLTFPNIHPGGVVSFTIFGWFYDVPDTHNSIGAVFSYTQLGREQQEIVARESHTILRGSTLTTDISVSESILGFGKSPFQIILTNTGEQTLKDISLPLPKDTSFRMDGEKTDTGTLKADIWSITELAPKETAELSGTITSKLTQTIPLYTLSLTPEIGVNGTRIQQKTVEKNIQVAHPQANITSLWENQVTTALPGTTQTLIVDITNTGDTPLSNITLVLPIPKDTVDTATLAKNNKGTYTKDTLRIDSNHHASFKTLAPGQHATIDILIPIRSAPQGTDITLSLTPQIQATVPSVPNALFQTQAEQSPALTIGTHMRINATARYYTDEGDQLGRGPLPPVVGKETKYMAIIEVHNTSSEVTDVQVQATLPAHVVWTTRTSVSYGRDVVYTPETRGILWQAPSIPPHTSVGLYMELSLTPQQSQIGTTPVLLQNIRLSAKDPRIGETLQKTHAPIDASLPNDAQAKQQGVVVTP